MLVHNREVGGSSPGWDRLSFGVKYHSKVGLHVSSHASYQRSEQWYQIGQDWHCGMFSSMRQLAAWLYAPLGVEIVTCVNRPDDLGVIV